jgi:hypothetical protein
MPGNLARAKPGVTKMNRITKKDCEIAANRLNVELGMPHTYCGERIEGRFNANIGHYTISCAYGGYALHQVTSSGGGIRDVFSSGHMPARELYGKIHAMLAGVDAHIQL